ncbi:MAG TPA: poly-beta-1,6-N-acetyl-D-glucosamine biosynthesis protein PgaD [Victivallales bacterium]|nr:poly-beta-1,6-N-acetyl-D-glucosamine biosynthesis protein PgaD [Victivallales bacterium]
MKKIEDFKSEMIIDKQDMVSKTRSFAELTLNTAGWILWFFLVRPLAIIIVWYVGYRFFKYHMFTLEGIDNPEYFGIGFGVVMLIFLSLFLWSRYNAWRFGSVDRRKSRGIADDESVAKHYKVKPENIADLKKASNVEVSFSQNENISIQIEDGPKIDAFYALLKKN